MSVRWECVARAHPAVLGPERPKADNACRFCLPCTEVKGKLVRRECPVVDKRRVRELAAKQSAETRELARELQRREAYYTAAGVRLDVELARLWDSDAASTWRHKYFSKMHRQIPKPTLKVRRAAKKPSTRYGYATYGRCLITITVWPGIDAHDLRETLAHEVAHIATPYAGHGVSWKACFRELCAEVYGFRPRVDRRFHGETSAELRRREIQAMLDAAVPGANEVAETLRKMSDVPPETRFGP